MSDHKYRILIEYSTGSSDVEERITNEPLRLGEISLSMAKNNLKRIKEHYEAFSESSDWGAKQSIKLLTTNGEQEIFPFWMGHFERLHGARIDMPVDDELSFEL